MHPNPDSFNHYFRELADLVSPEEYLTLPCTFHWGQMYHQVEVDLNFEEIINCLREKRVVDK